MNAGDDSMRCLSRGAHCGNEQGRSIVARSIAIAIAAVLLSAAAARAQAQNGPAAVLDGDKLRVETYGDARNVQLLSDLMRDDDALVRQRAALDLGQTHNPQAAPRLKALLSDSEVIVRCAALSALGELDANLAVVAARQAAGDKDATLVREAIGLIRQSRLADALDAVRPLVDSPDAAIAAAAVETLTELQASIPIGQLMPLLGRPDVRVKLAALGNALLLKPSASVHGALVSDKALEAELMRLAAQDAPAVRAAALAALGKLAFAAAATLLDEARKSDDPTLRRGAVWCYRYAWQDHSASIMAFLDDASPMVRLAAVQAAGALKRAQAADRLVQLMTQAPDEQMCFAAADALSRIGGQDVAGRVAAVLAELAGDVQVASTRPRAAAAKAAPGAKSQPASGPAATAQARRGIVERNIVACCRVMGELKSPAALKSQAAILAALPVENTIAIDVAASLGKIGDAAAVKPLSDKLKACQARGIACLKAATGGGESPAYEPAVAVGVIEAMGELKAADSLEPMLRVIEVNVSGMRLDSPSAAAARAIPSLTIPDQLRPQVEKAVISLLTDEGFGPWARFEAAKAAGKLNIAGALDALKKVLAERQTRQVMNAAAWAAGRLTGKVPVVGEPRRNQGNWIVTIVGQ